jgi:hypothetical protein
LAESCPEQISRLAHPDLGEDSWSRGMVRRGLSGGETDQALPSHQTSVCRPLAAGSPSPFCDDLRARESAGRRTFALPSLACSLGIWNRKRRSPGSGDISRRPPHISLWLRRGRRSRWRTGLSRTHPVGQWLRQCQRRRDTRRGRSHKSRLSRGSFLPQRPRH